MTNSARRRTPTAAQAVAFAQCRTLGHAWDAVPVTEREVGRRRMGLTFLLRCERCATTRHDVMSRATGELLYRRYDYEDGYRDAETTTRTRNEWRVLFASTLREVQGGALLFEVEPPKRERRLRAVTP